MYYLLYGMAFFIITLLIQRLLCNYKKKGGRLNIWIGWECLVVICILGIIQKEIAYFAAAIGFILADQIGEKLGWH